MKMKGLKKLLVSLGLCAVLTVGMSTAAFADSTEAILAPAPEENSIPKVPVLSTEEVDNATYVGYLQSCPDCRYRNFYFSCLEQSRRGYQIYHPDQIQQWCRQLQGSRYHFQNQMQN